MSRPYKIVTQPPHPQTRVTATDEVTTRIEIPSIVPPNVQSGIMGQILREHGFSDEEGGRLTRESNGVKVNVDPSTGEVTISAEESTDIPISEDDNGGCPCSTRLRQAAKEAHRQNVNKGLQGRVTDRLEKALGDLGCELEQVGNQVTKKALVQKAKQIGEVKRITHDNETGGVTIVVEV